MNEAYSTTSRLPERNLDVLRSVAVLSVLFWHVWDLISTRHSAIMGVLGQAGVLLFFVHTACVLMASLERGGNQPGWTRRFYIRRAFRIYPLSIVVILAVTALHQPLWDPHIGQLGSPVPVASPGSGLTAWELAANLSLSQNLVGARNAVPVLWSLPVEVQMYVILPLIFWLVVRTRRVSRIRAAVFAGVCLAAGAFGQSVDASIHSQALAALSFAPAFGAGVLLYGFAGSVRPKIPAGAFTPALVGLLAIYAFSYSLSIDIPERGWMLAIAVAALALFSEHMGKNALTRVAARIAQYSYGIYLVHMPAERLAFLRPGVRGAPWQSWVEFVVIVVTIPVILYHVVESPCIRLGSSFAKRLRVARPPDAAVIAVDVV